MEDETYKKDEKKKNVRKLRNMQSGWWGTGYKCKGRRIKEKQTRNIFIKIHRIN